MKRLLFVLAALLVFSAGSAFAAKQVTIYGDDAYEPYAFSNGGKPDGIYVKIFEQAFAKMPDYKVVIEMVPWKRALKLVEQGKGLAVFPPYYRAAERPWIDPWSEPILEEGFAAYCRNEVLSSPKPNWPGDYQGLIIGSNEGFSVPKAEGLNVQEAPNSEVNIKKLFAGRIDCYVNDGNAILYAIKQLGLDVSKVSKGTQISSENGYLAFSKTGPYPFKDDFVAQFNAIIKDMKANGEIDAIVKSFLGN